MSCEAKVYLLKLDSEAVSKIVNFKVFLGEHAPRPPSFSVLTHTTTQHNTLTRFGLTT